MNKSFSSLKNSLRKKKLLISSLFLSVVFVLTIAIIQKQNQLTSSASSFGYYNTYKNIVKIEDSASYSSTQGFSIDGTKAFYTKMNNTTKKSRVWMYNLSTGKKYSVFNGNTSNTVFDMGHANSIYVNYKYMYVAAQLPNKASLYRYTINCKNNKYYLTNKKTFCIYSHNPKITTPIAITGIEHSPELGGFLLKNGVDIYLGSFNNDQFEIRKHFTIDTQITVNTNKGTESINGNTYTRQGMYYKNGSLYLPMMNNNKKNQSIVVSYPLTKKTENNAILNEESNKFIRVTSSTYGKLFEIEEVAYYNGQMYANVNMTYTNGGNNDHIIKIDNFTY